MYIHTFIWDGPASIQVIQSEPGTYMDFGAWERIFFYGNENHWLERHSRNRRWLAEFSSEKVEVEFVDLPRTTRPPSGRGCRIWAFRQGQGRGSPAGKGSPPFCPQFRRAILPRQTSTARFPYTWEAQADVETTYST